MNELAPTDLPCHDRFNEFVFDTQRDHTPKNRRLKIAAAVAACEGCPMRARCLERELQAMRNGSSTLGVVGGTTQKERHALVTRPRFDSPSSSNVHLHLGKHNESGYQRGCRCDACRRDHSQKTAARRAKRGRTDTQTAWTRRFIRRLRAAALAESWALRAAA